MALSSTQPLTEMSTSNISCGVKTVGSTKTDGGTVYNRILINAKLQIGKEGRKNRTDWEKAIKEANVRTGL